MGVTREGPSSSSGPFVPLPRHDRPVLGGEKNFHVQFPRLGKVSVRDLPIGGGRKVRGDHVEIRPGLVKTDSIHEAGVASRLIYSSILPRDEESCFRNYPECIDEPEKEMFANMQKLSVGLAHVRAQLDRSQKRVEEYHLAEQEWNRKEENYRRLPGRVRDLEAENARILGQLNDLKSKYREKSDAYDLMREELNEVTQSRIDLFDEHKSLQEHYSEQGAKLEKVEGDFVMMRERLTHELESVKSSLADLRARRPRVQEVADVEPELLNVIRKDAIKEFRLSENCFRLKEKYAASHIRFGFYLARSFLEEETKQPCPTLVWSDKVMQTNPVDWKVYDPTGPDAESMVAIGLEDPLDDLDGPFPPFSFEEESERAPVSERMLSSERVANIEGNPEIIEAMRGIVEEPGAGGGVEEDVWDSVELPQGGSAEMEDPDSQVSAEFAAALRATEGGPLSPGGELG